MKNLTSMCEFVLEFGKEQNRCNYEQAYDRISTYANFLKQPLELWMFVPCDKYGNVLSNPKDSTLQYYERNEKYQQAKETCIFEDFEYCESQKKGVELGLSLFISPWTKDGRIYLTKKKESGFHSWFQLFTIEDLVQCDLQLTQTAIKQLGF